MQTLKSCLGSVDVVEKIYTDVDVSLDLKKAYEQLQLNETHLTDAQKDLLIFLRLMRRVLFRFRNIAKTIRLDIKSTINLLDKF